MEKIIEKGQLPGPLRKYETVIDRVIGEMGIRGKVEEFKLEGRRAVYQAGDTLKSNPPELQEAHMELYIREHFRTLLG